LVSCAGCGCVNKPAQTPTAEHGLHISATSWNRPNLGCVKI
jgi:hypothetical protein